jgi:signal transduction histidine kinase
MTPLSNLTIIVSATRRKLAALPAEVLRRAGADTRICSPQLDLWATLADRTVDAIVIAVGEDDSAPMAAYAPLVEDPRSKTIPCLLLLPPSASLNVNSVTGFNGVSLLPADCEESTLLRTVADVTAIRRRTTEYETEVRELTECLRNETLRADGLAKKLGNISHDLRNMLGVAYGFSCNLRDGVVERGSDAERTHLVRILEAIDGATHLLYSLSGPPSRADSRAPRRFSSMRPGRVQRTLVQLGRLVREVLSLLEQKAKSRDVRLCEEVDESVSVWADALKLKQVVVNLVDNAIKYGSQGGEVMVRVQWAQPNATAGKGSRRLAQISVCDRGPGIPEDLRERVFERGFRGAQDEPSMGQGIGLDLVREIVVQHGGSIKCDEADGSGAAFHVSIPPDLRERDRQGLLVLRDGDSSRLLVNLLGSADNPKWQAAAPKDDSELAHLVRSCAAAVIIPTNSETSTSDLLARLQVLRNADWGDSR